MLGSCAAGSAEKPSVSDLKAPVFSASQPKGCWAQPRLAVCLCSGVTLRLYRPWAKEYHPMGTPGRAAAPDHSPSGGSWAEAPECGGKSGIRSTCPCSCVLGGSIQIGVKPASSNHGRRVRQRSSIRHLCLGPLPCVLLWQLLRHQQSSPGPVDVFAIKVIQRR